MQRIGSPFVYFIGKWHHDRPNLDRKSLLTKTSNIKNVLRISETNLYFQLGTSFTGRKLVIRLSATIRHRTLRFECFWIVVNLKKREPSWEKTRYSWAHTHTAVSFVLSFDLDVAFFDRSHTENNNNPNFPSSSSPRNNQSENNFPPETSVYFSDVLRCVWKVQWLKRSYQWQMWSNKLE